MRKNNLFLIKVHRLPTIIKGSACTCIGGYQSKEELLAYAERIEKKLIDRYSFIYRHWCVYDEIDYTCKGICFEVM